MAGPSDLLTMGDQGDAVLVAESFISLLGSVPSKQLGADLEKASPATYVATGDPPFLDPRLDNDEIVYPAAVGGAGLVSRRWPACPTSC